MTLYTYENFKNILETYGFFSFILPFLLVFSIVFLLLEISNILKKSDNDIVGRKTNVIFSIGFAFTALGNPDIVNWVTYLIPNAFIWLLGVFLFVLAMAFIVGSRYEAPGWLRGAISLIIISAIVVIGANAFAGKNILEIGAVDYSIILSFATILIIFVIIIAIIAWVTSTSEKAEGEAQIKQ